MTQPKKALGKLVLLIGPSGVGKTAIMRQLREKHPEFHYPRSATTRARRPGEGDEMYHFVTNEEFDALLADGKVLEWAIVHGHDRYATILDEIVPQIDAGNIVLREVDVQGFVSIQNSQLFRDKTHPLQSIFILPQSVGQLVTHIEKRAAMTHEELQRRMHSMEKELAYADHCDARVLNKEGKLKDTVKEVERLILAA
jgi:guanylate kinase